MCTSQKETPHHSHPTAPLSRGLGAIADPSPIREQQPKNPSTPSRHSRLSVVELALPDREGASLFKSSLWNKRRYRFSLSPPPLPSLLSTSTSVLFSLSPHLAGSPSLRLRKLCYHGDAWGWGLIGGVCCDAATWWCSPPDWLTFPQTSLSNAETQFSTC